MYQRFYQRFSVLGATTSCRSCNEFLSDDVKAVSEATSATVSASLDLRSSLSIQPFEGSRLFRGGRYRISIDFSLEVVEKQSVCGPIFESEFIELTKKLKLTIASSYPPAVGDYLVYSQ